MTAAVKNPDITIDLLKLPVIFQSLKSKQRIINMFASKNWAIIKNGLPDSTAFTTLETFGTNLIAGIG
jgi:hypothetical protein